jgi:IS30 family transposase
MHKQFTESDRAVLAQLLALKVSKAQIAARLKKHRSAIYRELARNSGPLGYLPLEAQQRPGGWVLRSMTQAQMALELL